MLEENTNYTLIRVVIDIVESSLDPSFQGSSFPFCVIDCAGLEETIALHMGCRIAKFNGTLVLFVTS